MREKGKGRRILKISALPKKEAKNRKTFMGEIMQDQGYKLENEE
jgi:hypothetical protein